MTMDHSATPLFVHGASMSTSTPTDRDQSFAETALRLGGKTEEEARRMGPVDKTDEQVESLFEQRYQTSHSPIHQAVWDRKVPFELFAPPTLPDYAPCDVAMNKAYDVVIRRRAAGQMLDGTGKLQPSLLGERADAGYWGFLMNPRYGGQGGPSVGFSPFFTK